MDNDVPHPSTKISEIIAGLVADEEKYGSPLIMDEDFAADMREIIASRKPRDTSIWDEPAPTD